MSNFTNYSQSVGTTPVLIYPQLGASVAFIRIWNVSAPGGPTIWLSRYGTPGANQPGSFPLAPGEIEEFAVTSNMSPLPTNALQAVSTSPGGAITVEVG